MERIKDLPWRFIGSAGLVTYGFLAEYFNIGSQDWFSDIRPDLFAHFALGYISSSVGRLAGKNDLSSRITGTTAIISKEMLDVARYGAWSAISPSDLWVGVTGILYENYQDLKKTISHP